MDHLTKVLHIDIVIKILEYTGKIKYRSGVFIDQISKEDYRYSILLTKKIPVTSITPHWLHFTRSIKLNNLSSIRVSHFKNSNEIIFMFSIYNKDSTVIHFYD